MIPTVSIVVPNYNHARFLRQRVDTILAQTYQEFELILLDDCSTDESRQILQSYAGDPRVRLEFNDANSGSTFKQWNKGVRLARGKYVWIAESDDYADARLLERLVAVLKNDRALRFVYCGSRCVSPDARVDGLADFYLKAVDPKLWATDFRADGREMCRDYFSRTNPVPNASAVVLRRDAYEAAGGADESFRLCGDWKLWAAMALEGDIGYVAEPLNYFRYHGATARSRAEVANAHVIEHLLVVRWVLDRVDLPEPLLDTVRQYKAELWAPALMSLRVPIEAKRRIWREVRKIDPHPVRSAMRPAARTIGLKVQRHWREMVG